MDKLKFESEVIHLEDRNINIVKILINGEDLLKKIAVFEYAITHEKGEPEYDLSAGYSGMTPDDLHRELIDGWDIEYNHHTIYVCSGCRELGCWPMVISIGEQDGKVVWHKFNQPHRGPESLGGYWDYTKFPAFIFDKEDYDIEVDKLKQMR